MTKYHELAAEIARLVPELQRDSIINNTDLIERKILELIPRSCTCAFCGAVYNQKDPDFAEKMMHHITTCAESPVTELLKKLDFIEKVLKDPAAVWANMLRGEIAMPQAVKYGEECGAELEQVRIALDEFYSANPDTVTAVRSAVTAANNYRILYEQLQSATGNDKPASI